MTRGMEMRKMKANTRTCMETSIKLSSLTLSALLYPDLADRALVLARKLELLTLPPLLFLPLLIQVRIHLGSPLT